MPPSDPTLYIRRAGPSDARALSRICLLTADAGSSAEELLTIHELPGLVYACPYVSVPHTAGFVLVRKRVGDPQTETDADEKEEVLGYVLFAYDTRAFEEAAEREWYPPLRKKYPKLTEAASYSTYDAPLKDIDKHYIKLLHAPEPASAACISFSSAHLHIDLLPEVQRQGWGRRLINEAVTFLRDEKELSGLWLGMDPRNADAGKFYERLGFRPIEGAPSNCVGLKFEDWTFA